MPLVLIIRLKFNLPTGYTFTTQTGAVTVTNNNDANATTGTTSNITLTIATPDVTYVDAGIKITS